MAVHLKIDPLNIKLLSLYRVSRYGKTSTLIGYQLSYMERVADSKGVINSEQHLFQIGKCKPHRINKRLSFS